MLLGALAVLGLGSLACAYSATAGEFIAARTVLALSAGVMIPLVLPVAAVGLAVVAMLVPESRAAQRHGLDLVGVLASCAGLAILVYGFVGYSRASRGAEAAMM